MGIELEKDIKSFKASFRKFEKVNDEFVLLSAIETPENLRLLFRSLIDLKHELLELQDGIVEKLEDADASNDEVTSYMKLKLDYCDEKIRERRDELQKISSNEEQIIRAHEEKMQKLREEEMKHSDDEKTSTYTEIDSNLPSNSKIKLEENVSTMDLMFKLSEMQNQSNMKLMEEIFQRVLNVKPDRAISAKNMVQLNKLDPPTWEGNPRDYFDFKLRFTAAMSRGGIEDEYLKMTYLIKSVKHGQFLDRVKNCQTLDMVWNVIEMHVTKVGVYEMLAEDFRNMKPLVKKDFHEILRFTSELSSHCRRVRDLGMETCLSTIDFLLNIMRKISGELSRDINNFAEIEGMIQGKTYEEILSAEFIINRLEKIAKDFKGHKSDNYTKPFVSPNNTTPVQRNQNYGIQQSGVSNEEISACCFTVCKKCPNLEDCIEFKKLSYEDKIKHIYQFGFCFRCLKKYHIRTKCVSERKCKICSSENHHEEIHRQFIPKSVSAHGNSSELEPKSELNPSATTYKPAGMQSQQYKLQHYGNNLKSAILPHIPVLVMNGFGDWVKANILIDGGSDCSLVRNQFALMNGLVGEQISIIYEVVGGQETKLNTFSYPLRIKSIQQDYEINIEACGLNKVCGDAQAIEMDFLQKYEHLHDLEEVLIHPGGIVDILIGRDQQELHVELAVRQGKSKKDPVAVNFPLGWCLVGGNPSMETKQYSMMKKISHVTLEKPEIDDVRSLFISDLAGVNATQQCVCLDKEIEEKKFIKVLREKITINGEGRIEIKHPWRNEYPEKFPNNQFIARKLFDQFYTRLKKQDYFEEYTEEMDDLIKNNFVRKYLKVNSD